MAAFGGHSNHSPASHCRIGSRVRVPTSETLMPTLSRCVTLFSQRSIPIQCAMLAIAISVPAVALDAQPARASVPQLRADVAQLRTMMTDVEKSWTPATRAIAMARIDSLERAVDTISAVAFELAVTRIVATSDNGHSSVGAARRASRFNRVGLRLSPMGTDFIVMRTRPADADLLGARVLAIDGRPLAAVRDLARTLHGGTASWRDRFVPFTLESPEQLNALGLARAADAVTYRLELLDGRTVDRRLVGESPDPARRARARSAGSTATHWRPTRRRGASSAHPGNCPGRCASRGSRSGCARRRRPRRSWSSCART